MFKKSIARILVFVMWGLRPLFGPAECKFTISCTEFAAYALEEHRLDYALGQIIKRLVSCNFMMHSSL